MSGKKQRLKHTPGQRCREESIRAESAGRKGRIALWKIAVPVIIVLFCCIAVPGIRKKHGAAHGFSNGSADEV